MLWKGCKLHAELLEVLIFTFNYITQQLFLLAIHLFFDKANETVTRELK